MLTISQRRVHLALLGMQAIGTVLLLLRSVVVPTDPTVVFGTACAASVFILLFVACWRRWRYVVHITLAITVLLIVFLQQEPYITQRESLLIFFPTILALVIAGPSWVAWSAAATVVLLLVRAGGQGIYATWEFLWIYTMIVGGIIFNRINTDIAQRIAENHASRAEQALAQSQRQAQELVRQSAAIHFQADLLDMVMQSVIATDLSGQITYYNHQAEMFYGWKTDEAIGHMISEVVPDLPLDRVRSGEILSLELLVRRRDGATFPVLVTASPILDDGGLSVGIVYVATDITERKLAEEVLNAERVSLARRVDERTADLSAANAQLARASRLKDEFLASMSHELRTPLNAVLGLSEALQEEIYGSINERQHKALDVITESGQHLLALINDILDLSKIEAGKMEVQYGPVVVETLCQSSLQMIRPTALSKQLNVNLQIMPGVTVFWADERQLKQVLVNLLSNAVKFTGAGGSLGLEVEGDREDQVVRFTVWDTGIGIAPENMQYLFQPFVQLDSRLSRQYAGTGLGLALVQRMVELHEGSVTVMSTPGQGSRFTVALPWYTDAPGTSPADSPSPLEAVEVNTMHSFGAEKRRPTLLLAEDNEVSISMMVDYLSTRGYRVVVARTGAEALSVAREELPALILMDIQMPQMDGLAATEFIRADVDLAATPIIALTALAMPGDRERCLAAGATAYLSKPVSLPGLLHTIERHLAPGSELVGR